LRRRYSQEEKNKVIEMYKNGAYTKDISSTLDIPETNVVRWAKDAGLSRIKKVITKREEPVITSKIIELYKSGLKIREVADELQLSYRQVEHIISTKLNLTRHRGPQSMISLEDYFDKIDSEDKAYYLGWIMADGNVSITNGQYSLKMHISITDRCIIDSFLRDIGSTNKTAFKKKNGNGSYYVSLTSKKLVERLIELGVRPRKTGLESIPSELSQEMKRHFIRGYFDGDGITCIKKMKRSGFIGSELILEEIQGELETYQTISIANYSKAHYFLYGIAQSKILYDYMYSDSTIWLERKRKRMDLICGNTEVISRINKLLTP
jgi:hypothetical protein